MSRVCQITGKRPQSDWLTFMVNRNLIREFEVSEDDWAEALGEVIGKEAK